MKDDRPMTTQTIDVEQIKHNIDLRQVAERYTTLRRASGEKELCGPCPQCGGDDRFHVKADLFMCRHCHPKWGDAIEYECWWSGLDFKEACAKLSGSPVIAVKSSVSTRSKSAIPADSILYAPAQSVGRSNAT